MKIKSQTILISIFVMIAFLIICFSIVYTYFKGQRSGEISGTIYKIYKPIRTLEIFSIDCLEENRIRIGIYNGMLTDARNVSLQLIFINGSIFNELIIERIPKGDIINFETIHPNVTFKIRIIYKDKVIKDVIFSC